jgi:hypothetical protein
LVTSRRGKNHTFKAAQREEPAVGPVQGQMSLLHRDPASSPSGSPSRKAVVKSPGSGGATEPLEPGPKPVPNIEHITLRSGSICGGIEVSVIGSGFPNERPCTFGRFVAATIRQTEILCL